MNKNDKNYLFVTGHKRSGTTLLQMILSSHSKVCISPETKVISDLIKLYAPDKILNSDEIKVAKQLIIDDPKISAWHFEASLYFDEIKRYNYATVDDIVSHLLHFFCANMKPNAQWIGNKKGFYLKEGGAKIKKMFPDAKFIIIVRDCRAVVNSVMQTFNVDDCKLICKNWEEHIKRGQRLKEKYPNDVLEIRYEDLTLDAVATAKKMCSFLELDFELNMLQDYQGNNKFAPGALEIHPHLFQQINAKNSSKWMTQLSLSQIKEIEDHTSKELMLEYGYL